MNNLHERSANGETHIESGLDFTSAEQLPRRARKVAGLLSPVVDQIQPGHITPLFVPREDVGLDDDEVLGCELSADVRIRKPQPNEWIRIYADRILTTKMLIHQSNPEVFDKEFYFVVPEIRADIGHKIKAVCVYPYFSLTAGVYRLWIINITPKNPWYESLQLLLHQPDDFYAKNKVRVESLVGKSRYRVCHLSMDHDVPPPRETGVMLAEAIGEDHFIHAKTHPIYQSLMEGEELK